ncbi:MAG: type II secretion system protein N [Candidatus Omnitrophota bacterium]
MLRLNRFFLKFCLAVIWLITLVWGAVESSQAAVSSKEDTSSSSSGVNSGIDSALQMAQEEIRDPFRIAAETEAAVTAAPSVTARPELNVVLQGIGFGSKDAGYALIGDDIYYIGKEINGIKLLEVRRREVDILVNGGRMTVPLFPGEEVEKARERAKKKGAVKNAPADPSEQVPSPL